jgi:hypothetical protein
METIRLRAVQQPSRVERLLVAFASSSGVVAPDAYLLRDPRAMSAVLQSLIGEAEKQGHAWCCWADDSRRVWLLTGEMSLALSRECGSPVLDVKIYGEDGKLKESDCWLVDKDGKWRRCSVAIAEAPPRTE